MHSIRFSFVLAAAAVIPHLASAQPFDCDGVPASTGEAITLELIAANVSAPVDVTHAPGDSGRLFVVEQVGRIRIIDLSSGDLVSTPFLDIRSRVSYGG